MQLRWALLHTPSHLLWHIKQGIQRFNAIVGHLYMLHPQKTLWSQSYLVQIRTKEDLCINRRHVSSEMLINNLLCVAPLFLHLHSVVAGEMQPLGWGEKKPKTCAFLDFSTHTCVPRAWITDENVKHDENSGKTCLMCPSIKTDCKTRKESSREDAGGKKASGYIFLSFSVFIGMCKGGTVVHCLPLSPFTKKVPYPTSDLKSFCVEFVWSHCACVGSTA